MSLEYFVNNLAMDDRQQDPLSGLHIWKDDVQDDSGSVKTEPVRDEFVYPTAMFVLNIAVTVLYSAAIVFIFVKYWKPNVWPYAIIFAAMAFPVWRNLYGIYRGPRRWFVDQAADSVRIERFDGTGQTWKLSALRRVGKKRLGVPYRIVDHTGDLAFQIWMYVSRDDQLAALFPPAKDGA
jgi:hypothetical protein